MSIKKCIYIALPLILILASCGQSLPNDSLRTINQGEIIGIESDHNTFAWLGIPFAEPPVGNLRWKAPIQPKKFDSRFEASKFSQVCFQAEDGIRDFCLSRGLGDVYKRQLSIPIISP